MRIALDDLKLETLFVVYPGSRCFFLDDKIEAVGLPELPARLNGL